MKDRLLTKINLKKSVESTGVLLLDNCSCVVLLPYVLYICIALLPSIHGAVAHGCAVYEPKDGHMHCPISVYPWMVEGKYMLFMENACLPMKYSGYYHQLFVGAYVAVKR